MNRTQVTPDKRYARLEAEVRERKSADVSSWGGEESEEFLTARQLAAVLQVSESTVRRLARDGRIPCVRLTPRLLRFNLKSVYRALAGYPSPLVRRIPDEPGSTEANPVERSEVIRDIDGLRERLLLKYGEMSDSTKLIREDRAR